MKKFRQRILKMKEGFLSGKSDEAFPAFVCFNALFIFVIFCIAYIISAFVYEKLSKGIGICMLAISIISLFTFIFLDRVFSKTIPISAKILESLFGRYGLVVSKDDWKRIKKNNKSAYRFLRSRKNIGHCYITAWTLAIWIEDAKLMYCSVAGKNGQTAHAVVVKNNCVYDTNKRIHCDFDEYIKYSNGEVYKIFEEEEYCTEKFFENVYQDFMDWCAERNVYCDPQKNIHTEKR